MSVSLCGQLNNENTGSIDCDLQRQAPQLMMIGGATFDSSDYADEDSFENAVIEKTKLSKNDPQKLFPLPAIQGTTNKTEAAKDSTLGYGLKFRVVDSRPGFEFDIIAGSTLEKKLKVYDGKQVPMFIYDKGQTTWGIANKAGIFSGPLWQFALDARPFQDGQNEVVTKVTISLVNTDDWVANAAGVVASLNTASIKGLNDIIIAKVSSTTNVYTYSAVIPSVAMGKKVTAASLFGSALAIASLWPAKTGVGFATPLTITSVSVSGDNYIVTYDSTMYSALSTGAKIQQGLNTPDILDAANVVGVEGVPVIVTK